MADVVLPPVGTSGVGHVVGGTFYPQGKSATYCEMGNVGGSSSRAWACFPLTDIPTTAIVTAAILYLSPHEGAAVNSGCSVLVRAVDADNPSVPADYAAALALAAMPPQAAWSPATWSTSWSPSPDISDVIQAVINRSGYTSGDNALLLLDDNGSLGNAFRAFSSASGATYAPSLELTWETGPSSIAGDGGIEQARAVVSGLIGGSEGAVGAVTQNSAVVLGYGGCTGSVTQARAEVAGTITTQVTMAGAVVQTQAEVAGLGGAVGEVVAARAIVSGFISLASAGAVIQNQAVVSGFGYSHIRADGGVTEAADWVDGLIVLGSVGAGAVTQKRGEVSGAGFSEIRATGAVEQRLASVAGQMYFVNSAAVGAVVARRAVVAGLIYVDSAVSPMVYTGALR